MCFGPLGSPLCNLPGVRAVHLGTPVSNLFRIDPAVASKKLRMNTLGVAGPNSRVGDQQPKNCRPELGPMADSSPILCNSLWLFGTDTTERPGLTTILHKTRTIVTNRICSMSMKYVSSGTPLQLASAATRHLRVRLRTKGSKPVLADRMISKCKNTTWGSLRHKLSESRRRQLCLR